MSVEAIAVVLNHSQATGTDKVVLIGISNHEGDGGSYPSVRRLARYAGVSPRNVQKAIQRLVDLGEVKVIPGAGGSRSTPEHLRTNVYRIRVKCPAECDRSSQHRMPGDPGYDDGSAGVREPLHPVSPTTPPVANDTGSPPVASDTGAPVGTDTGPLSPATPEPSLEPPTEPSQQLNPPAPLSRQGSSCAVHDEPVEGCRGCGLNPRALQRAAQRSAAAAARETERARLEVERQARAAVAATPSTVAAVTQTARQAIAAARGR